MSRYFKAASTSINSIKTCRLQIKPYFNFVQKCQVLWAWAHLFCAQMIIFKDRLKSLSMYQILERLSRLLLSHCTRADMGLEPILSGRDPVAKTVSLSNNNNTKVLLCVSHYWNSVFCSQTRQPITETFYFTVPRNLILPVEGPDPALCTAINKKMQLLEHPYSPVCPDCTVNLFFI